MLTQILEYQLRTLCSPIWLVSSFLDLMELVLFLSEYHILTAQQPWCVKWGGF